MGGIFFKNEFPDLILYPANITVRHVVPDPGIDI